MSRAASRVAAASRRPSGVGDECSVCAAIRSAQDAFPLVFYAEVAKEPELTQEFAASERLCPAHTRSLLADDRSCAFLPAVVVAALLGLCFDLRLGRTRLVRPCPGCRLETEAASAELDRLVATVSKLVPFVGAPSRNLCVVHVRALSDRVGPFAVSRIAWSCAASLRSRDAGRRLAMVLREADPDASRRVELGLVVNTWRSDIRAELRDEAQQLAFDLEEDCCPACGAGRRAERRYLRSIAHRRGRRRAGADLPGLCVSHVNDLSVVAPRRFRAVLSVLARATVHDLEQLLDATGEPLFGEPYASEPRFHDPDGTGRGGGAACCSACAERDRAEQRTVAILTAELERCPDAYDYGYRHGVCARHVPIAGRMPGDRIVQEEIARRAELAVLLIRVAADGLSHDETERSATSRALADAFQLVDGRILRS
jgi:hypothetical protein